ncbi:hypothetical protein [Streptomyces similanensis]|uniref:Uncharacterized protein n=1 Tax=Streptomyces similanensis TaxID=1274988 RepID=A0ABP9KT78_9ACTN
MPPRASLALLDVILILIIATVILTRTDQSLAHSLQTAADA